MQKILVTGGSGFVGKAFLKQWNKIGEKAILLAPSSKELNLMDYEQTSRYLKEEQVDIIFHLAARLGGVGLVMNQPLQFLEDNLVLNYNIVSCAIRSGVQKFITLGSSCCYSNTMPLPMKEKYFWKDRPENTYGIGKLVLLEHLMAQKQMEWVYFVPPNLYGPGDHFGEKDAHFIPATVMKLETAKREKTSLIEVWGDGSQVRDFVYIEDLTALLLDALKTDRYNQKVLNVATGVGVRIKEIVWQLRQLLNAETIQIHWDETKPTGTKEKILDNQRLCELCPKLKFVTIEEGLKRTIEWYKRDLF